MVQFIQNFIGNDVVSTLIVSFIPLIELKGGIIFARGVGFGFWKSLGLSYLGSSLAFFPVFFLFIPLLKLLKKIKFLNNFALKIERYFTDKSEKAFEKRKGGNESGDRAEVFLKQLTVFIFVAIPLPMTGVYTGTAIAVFLGLKFKDSILPVISGNLVAGFIISLLAEFCIAVWDVKALDYILYGILAIAVIAFLITVISLISKKDKDGETPGKRL